jgi:hypothetical protein
MPSPIHKIHASSSDWLIPACGYFWASYAWDILILDFYSLSATFADHSSFPSHYDAPPLISIQQRRNLFDLPNMIGNPRPPSQVTLSVL